MAFDQLVWSIHLGSSELLNLTWPSPVGGAVAPHNPFFPSLLTHSLFACLSSWISPLLVERSCCTLCSPGVHLPSCFLRRKLPPEISNTHQQSSSKQRCETLRSSHMSLGTGPSGATVEALCCSQGSRFSTIINHWRCWNSVFLIDNRHRISRNWSSFTAATLSCVDANGGWWWCECSSSPF